MNYPLISEYVEAIKAAEDNFDQLKHLRPVIGDDGEPVMTSGNFAVVFKMKDEQIGKFYAVKCFTKEQEGRAEAYKLITEELATVDSPYILSIKYLEKELFVDTEQTNETEFPVLLMEWVEGKTLDKYLRENLDDKYALEMLAYRFSQLAQWLIPQPFAHGDLKPDNILVCEDGTLVLVDYDGMYVPAMRGQKARELGSPDFRHPSRTEDDFDEHIDDFPLISILFSLKAISLKPQLLEKYGAQDRLLLSENDYRDLSRSEILDVLKTLIQDAELAVIVSLFIIASSQNNLSLVSVSLINASKPIKFQNENNSLSTKVTDEDIANAWTDEYGVRYSHDKKRLLKGPEIDFIKDDYFINPKTKVICEDAFRECFFYKAIIPNGVEKVGNYAFFKCFYLSHINLPNSITDIGYSAFESCGLLALDIPDNIKSIGNGAFSCCKYLKVINLGCGLSELGHSVFSNCYDLEEIIIPNNIISIEKYAFAYCDSLKSISLPPSIKSIYEDSFIGCDALQSIIVPKGKKKQFEVLLPKYKGIIVEDTNLTPKVTEEDLANAWVDEFGVKYSADKKRLLKADRQIKKYSILKGTMVICDKAFESCNSMTSISIPDSVVTIGPYAFSWCESLKHITLPNRITNIGNGAFYACTGLNSITIPSSVTFVGSFAFLDCTKLTSVTMSHSIIYIGKEPFKRCSNLETIYISNGLFAKFEKLLPNYKDKIVEE